MPKSNRGGSFGRRSGTVTVIDEPVRRSSIRTAKIVFHVLWPVIGLLSATVLASKWHPILALFAGISRDGVTMVTGMRRGLSREDAVRFAFLLSTPVILAAGVLKIPDLFGPLGQGIGGPILLGSILSFIGAYAAIRFLVRYLRTNTLYPFGIYCLVAGLACVVYLGFVK